MPPTSHLLIAWAATSAPGCAAAWRGLALPHLDSLLRRLVALPADVREESSFSPPHERALGRALGLGDADGHIALAAHAASQLDWSATAPRGVGWAFVTPCHWQVRSDHVTLADPQALALTEDESRAYLAVLAPWFAQDGLDLHYEQPGRWLASGAALADLATASLDRVVQRDVRAWMPTQEAAAPLRRLHSEMQMLLYTHALNDAREARGAPPINAFWLHGSGALPAPSASAPATHAPQVDARLRAAALSEDWAAWCAAWRALDAGPIAALAQRAAQGQAVQITLCGERAALGWHSAPRSLGQRISSFFGRHRLSDTICSYENNS